MTSKDERTSAELKRDLLRLALEMWGGPNYILSDTERASTLRPMILDSILTLVMTDDERAKHLGLPNGCRVRESAKIIAPDNLECGHHVWIGENAIVDASGGLSIGAHTTIGTGVFVWSHTSVLSSLMGDNRLGNPWNRRVATRIGKNTFVGGPSVINPGVTIGSGCLILPMSVVTSNVPDNTMVGGAPAAFKRTIDAVWIERERAKFETGPSAQPKS
jgi:acetyltransferase-like isoleucine patch superfamily enzyme